MVSQYEYINTIIYLTVYTLKHEVVTTLMMSQEGVIQGKLVLRWDGRIILDLRITQFSHYVC